MSFGERELLWLLPAVPVIAALWLWTWSRQLRALGRWASRSLWHRLGLLYRPAWTITSMLLLTVGLTTAVLALAQPRWGTVEETVERSGVDVVFILDSSLSMAARDVAPSRLVVAKSLVRRLASELPGHRLALVQAEGEGVVLAPLTVDGAVIDLLLDTVAAASLPHPGTRLRSAVEQALRLYPAGDQKHRVLVLLSDGEDHGEGPDALLEALQEAAVVAHTIGIGTPAGAPIPVPGERGESYKQDSEGRVVITKLDEELLETIARRTGGRYLRSTNAGVRLEPVRRAIQSMEGRTREGAVLTTRAERFQWPLALTVLSLLLHLGVRPFTGSGEATR